MQKSRYFARVLHFLIFLIIKNFEPTVGDITNDNFIVFENKNVERFNHLVVHRHTGKVYVGAVNRIFKLSKDLKYQEFVEMGPRRDSPKCSVSTICPDEQKSLTDYYNKILVIDYSQSKLIACGSLFQGMCTLHDVDNVNLYETLANVAVAANNANASTVAFIAAGPKDLSRSDVLYVGASYSGHRLYRSDVPAVSSRSLDPANMFEIAYIGFTTGTKIMVNSLSLENYPIKYVFGFNTKGFSYFITVQRKHVASPNPFISKLIRICQNDLHYYSYTEVPLECQADDGTLYNLAQAGYVGHPESKLATNLGITTKDEVLFVIFAKSKNNDEVYDTPSANSALCLYKISDIHRKFTQNIQQCFNGIGERGTDFFNPSQSCLKTKLQISDDFCGVDINTPLGGTIPIKASPVLQYDGILLTAASVTSIHGHTIALLGTSTGHLKKVIIESATIANEYSDITIDEGSAVNPDMLFDKDEQYIYIMTKNRVTMMKMRTCHEFYTCRECISTNESYCGWCARENKCTLREECVDTNQDSNHWETHNDEKCVTVTKIRPSEIQRTTVQTLTLSIGNLPVSEEQLFCAFKFPGETIMTEAEKSASEVLCSTPHTIPSVPFPNDHITVELFIQNEKLAKITSTNFTFFDCSTYTSCIQCVSSPFPCNWCISNHRCTHNIVKNCHKDTIITGISKEVPDYREGPGFCPQFITSDSSSEILVPFGENKRIKVKLDAIPGLILMSKFICQIKVKDKIYSFNAELLADIIYCDRIQFSFDTQSPNSIIPLNVLWEESKPLDNPLNIHVLMYKCEGLARSCGSCVQLDSKYNCGWCSGDKGSCSIREQCNSSLLDDFDKCLESETSILSAFNRGIKILENDGEVIANCALHKELYEEKPTITCTSEELIFNQYDDQDNIIFNIKNKDNALLKYNCSFMNPQIMNFSPSIGPKSGGTHLFIRGRHMDVSDTVEVSIGDIPCYIVRRKPDVIECITSPSQNIKKDHVRIKFDEDLRVFEKEFEYADDPTIKSVQSGSYSYDEENIPKGIRSGGITVNVEGTNFNVVQTPKMYLIFENKKYKSNCTIISSKEMICESPSISYDMKDDEILKLDYGFEMGNVEDIKNISRKTKFPKFEIYPDPGFYSFDDKSCIKHFISDYLTINAENLNHASSDNDVTVRIGTELCLVTSLSRSQLTCRAPASQPLAIGLSNTLDKKDLPEVIVEIGSKLKFNIGWLRYKDH